MKVVVLHRLIFFLKSDSQSSLGLFLLGSTTKERMMVAEADEKAKIWILAEPCMCLRQAVDEPCVRRGAQVL